MTCEICVMNRHAAVLAADSASTVVRWVDGNVETRYFKGANKIFQLSHHQPVGVMIFNAAVLLHVPWEVLIKSFRDELAAKTFNVLEGYAEEFFRWLDGNARFFPEQVQKNELLSAAQGAAFRLVFEVVTELNQLNDGDAQLKLRGAIDARRTWLDQQALPNRISEEHAQRALAHRDAVGDALMFLGLPDDLRQLLADCSIHQVVKTPSDLLGNAGLCLRDTGITKSSLT
jgi:hypothetical protein